MGTGIVIFVFGISTLWLSPSEWTMKHHIHFLSDSISGMFCLFIVTNIKAKSGYIRFLCISLLLILYITTSCVRFKKALLKTYTN